MRRTFVFLSLIFLTSHAKHETQPPLGDDVIAAASMQEWSIYFSNARVASIFLSQERLNAFASGAHRFLPRLDAAPANAKQGVAPPSARWQQALMPKALFATARGPAVNRYLAFLMPPSLALRKMDNFRELWRKTHDRTVLPVILADEFCEPILERELYSKHEAERWHRPVMRNYWDSTVMSSNLRYLPLGPRHEFARVRPSEIKGALKRKYLYVGSSRKALQLLYHGHFRFDCVAFWTERLMRTACLHGITTLIAPNFHICAL